MPHLVSGYAYRNTMLLASISALKMQIKKVFAALPPTQRISERSTYV